MSSALARRTGRPSPRRGRYRPPSVVSKVPFSSLLEMTGKGPLPRRQLDFLRAPDATNEEDPTIYYAGDLALLKLPSVAIVGTRDISEDGRARASRLARELVRAGCTIVSGLARGVDTVAHRSALEEGGRTVAVIGTPIDKAYPAENAGLQEEIYTDHLLLTPFRIGETVFKGNFPKRNRVMAALSDATVIIEASDTSGTLHQAAECQRLKRWLFIARSVVDDPSLSWPAKFLGKEKTGVLTQTKDVLEAIADVRA